MSRLQRPLQEMPPDIRRAPAERGLLCTYDERPAYQRNDYMAWIARAKRGETRTKPLNQVLDELAQGSVSMNMKHGPSA
jgi:uncharacterized protein YdeI (YjbR/CyaY-like superfamily)